MPSSVMPAPRSDLAIAANGLRTSYGDKTVLDGIDLAAPNRDPE